MRGPVALLRVPGSEFTFDWFVGVLPLPSSALSMCADPLMCEQTVSVGSALLTT